MAREETAADLLKRRKDLLLTVTQKHVGADRAMWGSDPKLHLETVPTDIPQFDEILAGGFRRGRMGMLVGPEAGGKTLMTQLTIKSFQKRGYVCGFIDPERTYDEKWFRATGVRTEDLIVVRPKSEEQAFDMACEWAENKLVDLIVVDSLAALIPAKMRDELLAEKDFMGTAAKVASEGLRKLINVNIDSFILCTNQLRSKIGIVYGSPDEIPGGRAQKYYSSYTMMVRRGEWITKDGKKTSERIGANIKITVAKNRFGPPFQECTIPFMFTGTIDTVVGLVNMAVEMGVIKGKGGYFQWDGKTIHGLETLKKHFADSEEEQERLKTLLKHGDDEAELPDIADNIVEEAEGGIVDQDQPTSGTRIHKALTALLKESGFDVEEERSFPPYWTDCYVGKLHVAFEADGPQHSERRDSKRDDELMAKYALPVIHMTQEELTGPWRAQALLAKVLEYVWDASTVERIMVARTNGWQ